MFPYLEKDYSQMEKIKNAEMMKSLWIMQVSPESNGSCPSGRHTKERHTEEEVAMEIFD